MSKKNPIMPIIGHFIGFVVALAICVAYVGMMADMVFIGIAGDLSNKISSILVGTLGAFCVLLILHQACLSAHTENVVFIMVAAGAFLLLINTATTWVFPRSIYLQNVVQSEVANAAIFVLASYLMVWDRGGRIRSGADEFIDTVRSVINVWPAALFFFALFVLEALV